MTCTHARMHADFRRWTHGWRSAFFEQAGRTKRRKLLTAAEPGAMMACKLQLAKPQSKHAVAASTDGRLVLVQASTTLRAMVWPT